MQKIWHGIYWKILSCACFAGINVLVRYLSGGSPLSTVKPLPIYTLMFFQNIIGMLVVSGWMWFGNSLTYKELASPRPWLHSLRILTAGGGIALWYVSIRFIPITQVVALSSVSKIITILGAVLFLKETFNLQRKFAVFLSVTGGFLITRPDQSFSNLGEFNWFMLLPLLAAFVFSLDTLLTRRLLAVKESPRNLAWYSLTFITPFCLIPALHYGWVNPELTQWPWLILLGILGALSHYTFNKAYSFNEITVLLPYGVARLILCAVLSYIAFAEIPDSLDIWIGIAIITLSTIVLSINPASLKWFRTNLQLNVENKTL